MTRTLNIFGFIKSIDMTLVEISGSLEFLGGSNVLGESVVYLDGDNPMSFQDFDILFSQMESDACKYLGGYLSGLFIGGYNY